MVARKIKIKLTPVPGAWGQANKETGVIELEPRMDDKTMLEVATHEALHVLFPWMTEDAIDAAGIEVGRVLYKLGFRRADF